MPRRHGAIRTVGCEIKSAALIGRMGCVNLAYLFSSTPLVVNWCGEWRRRRVTLLTKLLIYPVHTPETRGARKAN